MTASSVNAKIVSGTLLLLATMAAGWSAQAPALFFPLDQVRPGLHGVGKTVFRGDHIEEFSVEILGVVENTGPQQSMILARLSGGPLADAGVIQGMSGSPVYIQGKLVGAVAFGFPFAKEAIAGIQPISQMLDNAPFSGVARPLCFKNSNPGRQTPRWRRAARRSSRRNPRWIAQKVG